MKCFECSDDAVAICKFCGRAVCAPHARQEAYVTGFTGVGGPISFTRNALRIEDAVWCGHCKLDRRVGA
jgi:hypothetical protein